MSAKTALALTFVLVAASGAWAATKTHSATETHNVYNPAGAYVGTDPDPHVRFELNRDWDRGR
jgi:hypothetical protein